MTVSPPFLQVERVSIDVPVLDLENARKGNVTSIVESLQEFGQHRPLVLQRSTNKIIVGNHTYKAAKMLGWYEIDVVFVDDDDFKSIRRSLADNCTGQKHSPKTGWNHSD